MLHPTKILLMAALGLTISATSAYSATPADAVLRAEIVALQAEIKALQTQIATINASSAMALSPFLRVDPNPENGVPGPNIVITGANLHIVNGTEPINSSNGSSTINGLGNLIIGYDDAVNGYTRAGSHNVILGPFNQWTANTEGSIMSGEFNYVDGSECAVIAGAENSVVGFSAVIINGGGDRIAAVGPYAADNPASYSTMIAGGGNHVESADTLLMGGSGAIDYPEALVNNLYYSVTPSTAAVGGTNGTTTFLNAPSGVINKPQ